MTFCFIANLRQWSKKIIVSCSVIISPYNLFYQWSPHPPNKLLWLSLSFFKGDEDFQVFYKTFWDWSKAKWQTETGNEILPTKTSLSFSCPKNVELKNMGPLVLVCICTFFCKRVFINYRLSILKCRKLTYRFNSLRMILGLLSPFFFFNYEYNAQKSDFLWPNAFHSIFVRFLPSFALKILFPLVPFFVFLSNLI